MQLEKQKKKMEMPKNVNLKNNRNQDWTDRHSLNGKCDQTSTYPFVETVCILPTVCQPLRECVAAGLTQDCMFSALQMSLSQQNRPDLTDGLTPLLLPWWKQIS